MEAQTGGRTKSRCGAYSPSTAQSRPMSKTPARITHKCHSRGSSPVSRRQGRWLPPAHLDGSRSPDLQELRDVGDNTSKHHRVNRHKLHDAHNNAWNLHRDVCCQEFGGQLHTLPQSWAFRAASSPSHVCRRMHGADCRWCQRVSFACVTTGIQSGQMTPDWFQTWVATKRHAGLR